MKTHSHPEAAAVGGEDLAVLQQARTRVRVPPGGWLRAGREAQGVPQKVLAAKLGIQRQAWAQFEGSEARGAISLYSLRRAADALGYELVYFLVPKTDSFTGGAAADPSATNGTTPAGLTPPPTGIETKTAAETAPVEGARANWFEAELPTELR